MATMVKIWDPLVRVFHWSLVASFATAWLTAEDWKSLHHFAGYAAGSLIAFRLIWGLVGTRYARFRQFVRSPATVIRYLCDIATGNEARYLGHNPAGGFMILALLTCMSGLCFTGWLSTTDAFWGTQWLEILHVSLANVMLGLVGLHVGGVILASLRHRESLVHAMVNGSKRAPGRSDIS
jgi:cytochrome b